MRLSFDEILDGDHFEDLVAAYFEELKNEDDNNIAQVEVLKSGIGTDGGRDILVEFDLSDDIKMFKRKWVIQCKFHDSTISPAKINTINIPTLIHSYGASGYLLVCKTNPTSGLTELFERLNNECKYNYKYECWNGSQLLRKILLKKELLQLFFPKYSTQLLSKTYAE